GQVVLCAVQWSDCRNRSRREMNHKNIVLLGATYASLFKHRVQLGSNLHIRDLVFRAEILRLILPGGRKRWITHSRPSKEAASLLIVDCGQGLDDSGFITVLPGSEKDIVQYRIGDYFAAVVMRLINRRIAAPHKEHPAAVIVAENLFLLDRR